MFTRHAGSSQPCPLVDFTGGWNKWLAAAYGLGDKTIKEEYGAPFGEHLCVFLRLQYNLSTYSILRLVGGLLQSLYVQSCP